MPCADLYTVLYRANGSVFVLCIVVFVCSHVVIEVIRKCLKLLFLYLVLATAVRRMSIMYIVYSSLFKGQCRTSLQLNDCLIDNSVRCVFCIVYLLRLLLLKKINL